MAKLTKDEAIKLAERHIEQHGMAGKFVQVIELDGEPVFWRVTFERIFPEGETRLPSFISVLFDDEAGSFSLQFHQ